MEQTGRTGPCIGFHAKAQYHKWANCKQRWVSHTVLQARSLKSSFRAGATLPLSLGKGPSSSPTSPTHQQSFDLVFINVHFFLSRSLKVFYQHPNFKPINRSFSCFPEPLFTLAAQANCGWVGCDLLRLIMCGSLSDNGKEGSCVTEAPIPKCIHLSLALSCQDSTEGKSRV